MNRNILGENAQNPLECWQAMPAADDQPHPLPKFLDQHHLSHYYNENSNNNNKERREVEIPTELFYYCYLLSHIGRVQLQNLSLATERLAIYL